MTWESFLLIYHLNRSESNDSARDSIKRAESKYSLLPNGTFIQTGYFFFHGCLVFAFQLNKKKKKDFRSVPLLGHLAPSPPFSPTSNSLFPYNGISHINGGLVCLIKALPPQSPFPLVLPSLTCGPHTQLPGSAVFAVRVWSRPLGRVDLRLKMTKDMLSHYGPRRCMQCHVWVMLCVCVCVYIYWKLTMHVISASVRACVCTLAISHGFICPICTARCCKVS